MGDNRRAMVKANVNRDLADLKEDKDYLKAQLFANQADLEKQADEVSKGCDDLHKEFV